MEKLTHEHKATKGSAAPQDFQQIGMRSRSWWVAMGAANGREWQESLKMESNDSGFLPIFLPRRDTMGTKANIRSKHQISINHVLHGHRPIVRKQTRNEVIKTYTYLKYSVIQRIKT